MTQLTDSQVFAELYYTGKAIKDILGITVFCWRPPYGDVDDRVRAIAQGLGMITTVWSDDTDDWEIEPEGTKPASVIEQNYESIINKDYSTHGNIVLTHEIDQETMDMMMKEYPTIKKKFKQIQPITACMNQTRPYAEDVTFPTFAEYSKGDIEPKGYPDMTTFKIQNSGYYPKPATNNSANTSNHGRISNWPNEHFSSGSLNTFSTPSIDILYGLLTGFSLILMII